MQLSSLPVLHFTEQHMKIHSEMFFLEEVFFSFKVSVHACASIFIKVLLGQGGNYS